MLSPSESIVLVLPYSRLFAIRSCLPYAPVNNRLHLTELVKQSACNAQDYLHFDPAPVLNFPPSHFQPSTALTPEVCCVDMMSVN